MTSTQIPVAITYHRPGTHPPLYIAGTFSNPPWQPYEMDHTTREDGEYDFRKEVRGEPGSKIQYKFRIGNGDWWVLKDDGPTVTDSSGNTNHVLEVKPEQETTHGQGTDRQGPHDTQGTDSDGGSDRPLSYAKVASKRLQPSSGQSPTERSATGTPIPARVAAEVADSAELLHEEVPERERDEAGGAKRTDRRMSEEAETAADVANSAQALDRRQSTIVILEPPPGEGSPFKVQPRGAETPDDQEGYIADKSPLFSHECVGMYEPGGENGENEEGEEDLHATSVEDFEPQHDPQKVDLNDPTLERFPSSRDDIMDAVRKLESGLPADHASFDGNDRSPVVNPSRRGTEDITGDFSLAPPPTSSPPTQQRPPKRSPRGSISSLNATPSLHSISEGDETPDEEESVFRSAVVFSNPLKAKPKHLKLPTSDEDEGIALREGVSPRTVKPVRPSFMASGASPTHSPPSPRAARKGGESHDEADKLTSAEAELHKDKTRSLEEVKLHPAPSDDSGGPRPGNPQMDASKPGQDNAEHPKGPSYARVASTQPTKSPGKEENAGKEDSQTESPIGKHTGEDKNAVPQSSSSDKTSSSKDPSSQAPQNRRPSYAEVVASQPPRTEDSSENKPKPPQSPTTEDRPVSKPAAPQPTESSNSKVPLPETGARRPSYAEVTASKPSSTDDKDKSKAKATTPPTADSSTSASATTTARDTDTDAAKNQPEPADLRRRGGGARGEQSSPAAASDAASDASGVPAVQIKKGGGWIKAVFRLVFVDFVGGFVKRVLRMFRMGWVLAMLGVERGRGRR